MLNMREIVNEVLLRSPRHNVSLELDPQTIATFANDAMKEVQSSTQGMYPERYGRRDILVLNDTTCEQVEVLTRTNRAQNLPITVWRTALPNDCTDVLVAALHYKVGTVTYNREMRKLDRRELHTIQGHTWNSATITAPVYGIEYDVSSNNPYVYFSGVDTNDTNVAASGSLIEDAADTTPMMEVLYIAAMNYLELEPGNSPLNPPDYNLRVPWIFTELIILNTMIDCFQKIEAFDALSSVTAEKQFMSNLIEESYELQSFKRGPGLPSRESLYP